MLFDLSDIKFIKNKFNKETFSELKSFHEAQGFLMQALLCDIWEMLYLLLAQSNNGNDSGEYAKKE